MTTLNEHTHRLVDIIAERAERLRIVSNLVEGARVLDLGIATSGSLQAGLELARVCTADRADFQIVPSIFPSLPGVAIQVTSDDPVIACMACQYAGWEISVGKYFAMGSGPMRAALGKEALYDHLPGKENAPVAVGVLETRKLPSPEVITTLAEKLQLTPQKLSLLCAPTGSIAGSIQVVARSLETALHKLHEIGFDLTTILSGHGVAPLPPIAADDLTGIGWTNDAILYGGQVTIWVRCDDEMLAEMGPKVPSSASSDHGAPFKDIFERAGRNFYKIDRNLFSPARITFVNLASGRQHTFGQLEPEILRRSFGVE